MQSYSRRRFLATSALLPAAATVLTTGPASAADATTKPIAGSLKGSLFKSLKIGMVKEGKTMAEKFAVAKAAGFDGIELDAPGFDVNEVRDAIQTTGLPVDGTVCSSHWQVRHSDPDPKVRAEALETLLKALEATHLIGGHSVLLVVGRGTDGTEQEVWERSVTNIKQAIPLASRLGVAIAIENVWNQFCYDHEGGADQSAEKFVRYVDEFSSPWVGMHFDIGNHWKYGNAGDWIRALGKRIIKLDIKGFSRKENKFTAIDEGDIDYPDVVKALVEIGYHGWCAAEVKGGDQAELAAVAAAMDKVFEL